ncbi:hypothetical protein BS47DRAFT_1291874 [Hydnum rufescens UP504]|uniref:FAD-binding PCMH-type domain-containing protein n=1 Tax=Hydnum rufescens UP504 TaxID=1448309 RepID=A0A9P6B3F6_9AGAM|nr:hypothetical protein BS47DRAFT_1291874 [Hydnum rufescens UP504]
MHSIIHPTGEHDYRRGIRHHFDGSSQTAECSVEPGSAADLAKIMKVIKEHNVEFAVKGGGHTSNPGFSSTRGIHIALSRFRRITYNEGNKELTVGAGCLFHQISDYMRGRNRNIVGGGIGVGIGGWMTGGGYSLKTNQYGLGIDNLVQIEIVTPDGEVERAAEDLKSDLFWAVKGGGNNFGIVTEFVVKTHFQRPAYAKVLIFKEAHVEDVKRAILEFITRKDPKAAIVAAFRYYLKDSLELRKDSLEDPKDSLEDLKDSLGGLKDFLEDGSLSNFCYNYLLTRVASTV